MTTKPPIVIKPEDGIAIKGVFGGHGRRMLNASHSKNLCMGILWCYPGESPHRWHSHEKPDQNAGFTVHYPEGFEEAYVVIQGKGLMQWKEDGEVKEIRVETGDTVYFPWGVHEHQLLNDQETPLAVVYATAPPVV